MYYLSRQLARINAQALAAHEGRAAPDAIDRLVSEQEARFLRFDPRISKSVFGFFDSLANGFALTFFIVLLLSGFAAWKLGGFLLYLIFGSGAPSDPLQAQFPGAFQK